MYGEKYHKTHAPVVSFNLVRIFLYIGRCLQILVAKIDVKTALLNGKLEEDVWVMSPKIIPGMNSSGHKLDKEMYGLKKSHLECLTNHCTGLHSIEFKELQNEPCVFRHAGKGLVF